MMPPAVGAWLLSAGAEPWRASTVFGSGPAGSNYSYNIFTTFTSAVSYLEELEKRFHEDPQSIDRTWASFFQNLGQFL